MSWALFKANILRYANDPDSLQDIDSVARLWAKEYDAAIKRGFDTVNFVTLKQGNVQILEELFKAALLKGQTSRQPYDLVGEMGNAVKAYWAGAIMNEVPIPLIPAPGSTSNISVVSNIVVNPGTWTPPLSAPSTPTPPVPLEEVELEEPENVEMSEEELAGAKEDLQAAERDVSLYEAEGLEEEAATAEEQIRYQNARIQSNQNTSVPVNDEELTEEQKKQIEENKAAAQSSDIGKRIVAYALMDLGVTENPLPPGKPENSGTRVLQMLANTGIKGPAYWCAAAVTTWYKAAGAKYPPSGAASCDVWMNWAKKNGLFSRTPVVGAAMLYGSPSDAHHIGIVETVNGSKITTIEGNTSGGGFNRNGVGVFRKTPNPARAVGFVLPIKK